MAGIWWRRTEEAVMGAFNMATQWLPLIKQLPVHHPRRSLVKPYVNKDGLPIVAKVEEANGISASEEAVWLLGGLKPLDLAEKTVLVKPNFNSPHPYPATTDPVLLVWLIDSLRKAGAAQVIVGESSGAPWWPTRKVLERLDIPGLVAKAGAELIIFEEDNRWLRVPTGGRYFPEVVLPAVIMEADVVVYLSLMKTHRYARLSGALKLAVGLLHPAQRKNLHLAGLEEKIVDINRAFAPDLVIADCRRCFVTEGPTLGVEAEPGVVLASANQVAVDCEGVLLLQSFQAKNQLTSSPRELPFLKYALTTELAPSAYAYQVLGPGGQWIVRSLL